MRKKESAPTFKPYIQNQINLLPPSLESLVPPNHPVRVVNAVIDRLDLASFIASYAGGGRSSYHPVPLLKILSYAYLRNIYSSRKIEEAVQESVHFMWLSGGNAPDHNTIARFRSGTLKGKVRDIFSQIVQLLAEEGQVTLKEAFVDGTKIEANANRYTFVWGKSIKRSKERIAEQLKELLDYADKIAGDDSESIAPEFKALDADKVRDTIAKINERIAEKEVDPKVRQKIGYAKKHWPQALERYEKQEEILGDRNSYSKTDEDATFMRTKDDHMGNGQLKPCYNLQISTENQYITNYTVHQNPTDTRTLKPHVDAFEASHGNTPEALTADAGYGSEENYEYLESKGVEAFVKFNKFHQEQHKGIDEFDPDGWAHDTENDRFTCPAGVRLIKEDMRKDTVNGFEKEIHVYRSEGCGGCPFRERCHKSPHDRKIEINHRLRVHKAKARERLKSERGVAHRKQRCHEPETVFGDIKFNRKFTRYSLRGLQKVEAETALLAIAHNLKKLAA